MCQPSSCSMMAVNSFRIAGIISYFRRFRARLGPIFGPVKLVPRLCLTAWLE
jgi:hypothetical protein